VNLSEEIGGGIDIVTVPGDVETEELIRMVSEGEIDYTVADENVALLNRKYYKNIDVETAISFPQKIAWAVRKNSPELLQALNDWILKNRNNNDYITVYNKYFRSSRAQKKRLESPYSSIQGSQISEYDESIKTACAPLEWDWRLIASVIYQESKFDPQAESWTGASGLMQIMPDATEKLGVTNLFDPEENIKIGIGYLSRLDKYWSKKIPDDSERIKFVLASYNVGLGHIKDARRLAEKNGAQTSVWDDNVGHYLLQKSKPKYFNDPVVKHGYCRGSEPFNYVKKVLKIYDHYKNTIPLT